MSDPLPTTSLDFSTPITATYNETCLRNETRPRRETTMPDEPFAADHSPFDPNPFESNPFDPSDSDEGIWAPTEPKPLDIQRRCGDVVLRLLVVTADLLLNQSNNAGAVRDAITKLGAVHQYIGAVLRAEMGDEAPLVAATPQTVGAALVRLLANLHQALYTPNSKYVNEQFQTMEVRSAFQRLASSIKFYFGHLSLLYPDLTTPEPDFGPDPEPDSDPETTT